MDTITDRCKMISSLLVIVSIIATAWVIRNRGFKFALGGIWSVLKWTYYKLKMNEGLEDLRQYLLGLARDNILCFLRPKSQIEKKFEALATGLTPSPKYIQAGTKAVNSVINLLVRHSNAYGFKIARRKTVGSIGKGTAISFCDRNGWEHEPDFDCIIFINDLEPPFDTVLRSISEIIQFDPCVTNILPLRKISIGFTYEKNGYKFKIDLLPAPNLVKYTDDETLQGRDVGELGAEIAEKKLRHKIRNLKLEPEKIRRMNKLWSSSFAEKTLSFISAHMKDPCVLNVVFLAKLWNSSLEIREYVPARSYMMEVVAIYAQQQNTEKWNIISGFRNFLQLMEKFSSLTISISGPIHQELKNWSANPLIADPVNPYNNLAGGVTNIAVRTFEIQARKTLEILDDSTNWEEAGLTSENAIDAIFCHKKGKRKRDKTEAGMKSAKKLILALLGSFVAYQLATNNEGYPPEIAEE